MVFLNTPALGLGVGDWCFRSASLSTAPFAPGWGVGVGVSVWVLGVSVFALGLGVRGEPLALGLGVRAERLGVRS